MTAEGLMEQRDKTVRDSTGFALSQNPRRILIVDDSRDARTILQMLLTKLGHETKTAEDGPTGIAVSREFRPDIVLCDITMSGGMSGFAFARTAREDATLAQACLVAVSGRQGAEYENEAYAAGFDRIATKPVDLGELQQIVDSLPHRPRKADTTSN